MQKELQFRAVAYINVDIAVRGNYTLQARGVNSFRDVVYEATKIVDNPDDAEVAEGRPKLYDSWLSRQPDDSGNLPS